MNTQFEIETAAWHQEINDSDVCQDQHNAKLKDICTRHNMPDYYATWAIF